MSDVKVEVARNGTRVLVLDGRATASLVDPEREAATWLASHRSVLQDRLSARTSHPIVVIGVGSGFHIAALSTLVSNRIIAVDGSLESIGFARSELSLPDHVAFQHLDEKTSIREFFAQSQTRSYVTTPLVLVRHRPTLIRQPFLLQAENWILGRTPEAFAEHLRLRPELAARLDVNKASRVADVALLSIRDLAPLWSAASDPTVERRLFRILEELVR